MIAVAEGAAERAERCVADRSGWPVVEVTVAGPEELEQAVDELEAIVATEQPFALLVHGPSSLAAWQRLLWGSPSARRRLRRLRPSLGTWCAGSAHVVDEDCPSRAALRPAELAWGCHAQAFADPPQARRWLSENLAAR